MRKDATPLERYDAGEDVPATDIAAQTGCAALSFIAIWAVVICIGFPLVFAVLTTLAHIAQ